MNYKNPSLKPLAFAIGTALATTASGVAFANAEVGNPFGVNLLAAGYMVDSFLDPATGGDKKMDDKKAAEGKCGEGKCGEGKCGSDKMGAHVNPKTGG